MKKLSELFLLEALEHLQLADAVLVEEPRHVVTGALAFVEDDAAFPLHLGLDDLQIELVGVLPDRGEASLHRLERARVHRIVREVELVRANGLDEGLEQVGNEMDRERRLVELVLPGVGWYRRRHVGRSPISLTCATSLSPRPLTQSSTASSCVHRSLSSTIQLDRVRRFERGNDSLESAQYRETLPALRRR